MELIFQGEDELMKFVINRTTKHLQISSSKTGYKLTVMPWKSLFDPGKEKGQEEATDKMDDEEFKGCIVRDMKFLCYELK